MNENLKDIGFVKHMTDRFKSNLAYLQMPLLFYTAVISTFNYIPWMSGYLGAILVVSAAVFVCFACFAIYVDYKYIFKPERDFLFKQTPHLEKRFNEINEKIDRLLGDEE